MSVSRIPEYSDHSFDGMLYWFASMSERGLLFHTDDPADEIFVIATGEPMFSSAESRKANAVLEAMFNQFGDEVYEAAYPIFMKRMGIQLDA
jgi:hypothetical protein